jgi:hypothetical protein
VAFLPQSRFSPRVDVGRTFYVVPGSILYASPDAGTASPRATATLRARIANTPYIFAGVDYRLTARQLVSASSSLSQFGRRFTIGGQFAFGVRAAITDLSPVHDPGGGAFVSYCLSKYVSAEGAFNLFTTELRERTPWDGGRLSQVLGGVQPGFAGSVSDSTEGCGPVSAVTAARSRAGTPSRGRLRLADPPGLPWSSEVWWKSTRARARSSASRPGT